jgi:hypothetical protein
MEAFLFFLAFIIIGNFVDKRLRGSRIKKKNNTLLQQTMDFQRQTMEREAMEQHQRFMEEHQRDMERQQQQMNNNMHNNY